MAAGAPADEFLMTHRPWLHFVLACALALSGPMACCCAVTVVAGVPGTLGQLWVGDAVGDTDGDVRPEMSCCAAASSCDPGEDGRPHEGPADGCECSSGSEMAAVPTPPASVGHSMQAGATPAVVQAGAASMSGGGRAASVAEKARVVAGPPRTLLAQRTLLII